MQEMGVAGLHFVQSNQGATGLALAHVDTALSRG
jgi:hypothetical protein